MEKCLRLAFCRLLCQYGCMKKVDNLLLGVTLAVALIVYSVWYDNDVSLRIEATTFSYGPAEPLRIFALGLGLICLGVWMYFRFVRKRK